MTGQGITRRDCLPMPTPIRFGLLLIAAVAQREAAAQSRPAPDLASHPVGAWGIDLTDRDSSIKPGDDFYRSQNGAWLARTELGPTRSFAAYWADLRRLAPRRLGAIVKAIAENPRRSAGGPEAKAAGFYRSFMDQQSVEARGLTPLDSGLQAVRGATTPARLARLMGAAAGPGTEVRVSGPRSAHAPFFLTIGQDQRNPGRYAVALDQGGLGLPGPEYYSDPKLADIKTAYQSYVTRLLHLIGWPDAETRGPQVVTFETRIASVTRPNSAADRVTVGELARLAPGFDWRAFFGGAGLDRVSHLDLDRIAVPSIARIVAETPLEVLQARQAFALVDGAAPNLDSATVAAEFDFRYRMFNNQSAVLPPREQRALTTLEASIGEILGALYVKTYFSPAAKARTFEMIKLLTQALDARLTSLEWMSPATRAKARAKLATMRFNIGYPDQLPDFRGLVIRDDDLYGNVTRATALAWRRQVARLSRPFDRSEWVFTPQSVNYSYTPSTNTLEIPSATLEPPFFDLAADPAVNYGAIGALIGSMMVAAFDDQGRHYDAAARRHEWWTAEESSAFEARLGALAGQYSAVEPLPGLHVNGALVANEAFDDLGGMVIALDAYHLALNGRPAPVLDGFTGDQRVFLGRAQMWRAKMQPIFIRNQVAMGQNAQPFLRVNGPLRNIDAWYEAFNVAPGDGMFLAPKDRVRVW